MQEEKETCTAQEQMNQLRDSMESGLEDVNILEAMNDLKATQGIEATRTFLLEMMLKTASNPNAAIGDEEQLHMMQIFQVFNVAG